MKFNKEQIKELKSVIELALTRIANVDKRFIDFYEDEEIDGFVIPQFPNEDESITVEVEGANLGYYDGYLSFDFFVHDDNLGIFCSLAHGCEDTSAVDPYFDALTEKSISWGVPTEADENLPLNLAHQSKFESLEELKGKIILALDELATPEFAELMKPILELYY